nr:amidohydrolase family protein [bacterium]
MQTIPPSKYPRSPYVAKREMLDDGFSQGWGFHFPPSESYWVDCHVHLRGCGDFAQVTDTINRWFHQAEAYRLGRVVCFVEDDALFDICGAITSVDPRFSWFYWPSHEGDLKTVERALRCGAVGLKLHNHLAMEGVFDPSVWESPRWQDIFACLNQYGAAVNWHVTQRVAYSPYHGGGDNAYWSVGRPRGVAYTNQDLLEQFLRIAQDYPHVSMIGAHQLYLSNARLRELFDAYPNVFVDTSVGYFLRWADTLEEADRDSYRSFLIDYGDRVLFGSDTMLMPQSIEPYLLESWKCHIRFLSALKLPFDTLQMIAHGNAERLMGLPTGNEARKYSTRP